MGRDQHVVPNKNGKGWAVKTEGVEIPIEITKTKKEAIKIAIEICKIEKSELLIHGKNGKIQNKNSYGNDPIETKG